MHFSFLLFTLGLCQRSLLSTNKRLTMVRPKSYSRTNSKCDRVCFFFNRSEEMAASGATIMPQKTNQKVIVKIVFVFYDEGYKLKMKGCYSYHEF